MGDVQEAFSVLMFLEGVWETRGFYPEEKRRQISEEQRKR